MEKHGIIWDWNGTLLDDVQLCVQCINLLLKKRNLPELTLQKYREVFGFPVKDYYQRVGFDFSMEKFEIPAQQFMQCYNSHLSETPLFPCVQDVLSFFQEKGFHQFIISATEHRSLVKILDEKGLLPYFDAVSGIDDIYAGGKIEMAHHFMKKLRINPQGVIFVGDTLHDREVALSLGIDYLLVASGHQSKDRLWAKTSKVINTLAEIKQKTLP